MSLATDDGYMVTLAKRPITLTTIPGQISRNRTVVLDELFAPDAFLSGLIFVASNGYDHIWPGLTDTVAAGLRSFDLDALRERNRLAELENFREICTRIRDKYTRAPDLAQPWVLILVNKFDLWASNVGEAEEYYLPECGSDFDMILQNLKDDLGNAAAFRHYLLPLATEKAEYKFQTSRGSLVAPSILDDSQCNASLKCLVETLEALRGT